MKKVVLAMSLVLNLVIFTPGKAVAALDEQYSWAEDIQRAQRAYQEMKSTREAGLLPIEGGSWQEWTLIGSNEIETARMYHTLTTYELWSQTQDVRWGKAIDVREAKPNNSTYGYVRIRFENIFGEPIEKTDSGRVWGYGRSEAVTPEPSGSGYLRAYCGD